MPLLALLLTACASLPASADPPEAPRLLPAAPAASNPDPFSRYLSPPFPVASTFGSPVGKGWKKGGGTWEGSGPVLSVMAGFLASENAHPVLRSSVYENHLLREIEVEYRGLRQTAPDGPIALGATIGAGSPLEIVARVDGEEIPFDTLKPRFSGLPDPREEPWLALVSHELYALRTWHDGREIGHYDVSFGQEPGAKKQRGDNRTPKGMYFVVGKSKGPFTGPAAAYYGGHWTKIDYPNAWDAARGVEEGLIDPTQQKAIAAAWRNRALTLQDTQLGGGIGFHGWAVEWSNEGPRHLSWGCIVVHLSDVEKIYAETPVGTMVVVF